MSVSSIQQRDLKNFETFFEQTQTYFHNIKNNFLFEELQEIKKIQDIWINHILYRDSTEFGIADLQTIKDIEPIMIRYHQSFTKISKFKKLLLQDYTKIFSSAFPNDRQLLIIQKKIKDLLLYEEIGLNNLKCEFIDFFEKTVKQVKSSTHTFSTKDLRILKEIEETWEDYKRQTQNSIPLSITKLKIIEMMKPIISLYFSSKTLEEFETNLLMYFEHIFSMKGPSNLQKLLIQKKIQDLFLISKAQIDFQSFFDQAEKDFRDPTADFNPEDLKVIKNFEEIWLRYNVIIKNQLPLSSEELQIIKDMKPIMSLFFFSGTVNDFKNLLLTHYKKIFSTKGPNTLQVLLILKKIKDLIIKEKNNNDFLSKIKKHVMIL